MVHCWPSLCTPSVMQAHMARIASQLHAVRVTRHYVSTGQKPTTSRPTPCIRTFPLQEPCAAMALLKVFLPWNRTSTRLRGGSIWTHWTFDGEIMCKKATWTPWRWKKWTGYGAQNASFVHVVCRNAWQREQRPLVGMSHLIVGTAS